MYYSAFPQPSGCVASRLSSCMGDGREQVDMDCPQTQIVVQSHRSKIFKAPQRRGVIVSATKFVYSSQHYLRWTCHKKYAGYLIADVILCKTTTKTKCTMESSRNTNHGMRPSASERVTRASSVRLSFESILDRVRSELASCVLNTAG